MIITCPSCRTRFQIAPASLGSAGRTVRCSSCGERWFVEPFTELPPPLPLADAVRSSRRRRRCAARRAQRRQGRPAARRPGGCCSWRLLAGRNEIAARLPTTVPLYQLLGLPLELPLGMEFRELELGATRRRRPAGAGGDRRDRNVSGQPRDVPPIRVALLDADRRELDFGLFDPPRAGAGAGRPSAVRGPARRAAARGQRLHGLVRHGTPEREVARGPDGAGPAGGAGGRGSRRGAGGCGPGGARWHGAGARPQPDRGAATTPRRTPRCW